MPYFPPAGGGVLLPNSIDNALLADMAQATVKGRAAGAGTGDPQDLTAAQLSLLLGGPNFRNILGRNGGFEVWQRGAGGAASIVVPGATSAYTVDGWYLGVSTGEGSTISQQAGLTTGSRYCARVQRNATNTGAVGPMFEFPLDTDEIVPARSQIVALSLTLRAGANWSPASGNIRIRLLTGTGTPAKRWLGPLTGEVTDIDVTQALTTTATRFTFMSSSVLGAAITQATVALSWLPVGTAGAADYFEIDDVQLEVGSVATPFERRPFESELAACRRHFQKSFNYTVAPQQNAGNPGMFCITQAVAASVGMYTNTIPTVPELRVMPTYTLFNPYTTNAQARNVITGTDCTATAAYVGGTTGFNLSLNTPGGSVPGNLLGVHWTADAGI